MLTVRDPSRRSPASPSVDELSEASFPASDAPSSWTWDPPAPSARPAGQDGAETAWPADATAPRL
jgi:hypothetical protein